MAGPRRSRPSSRCGGRSPTSSLGRAPRAGGEFARSPDILHARLAPGGALTIGELLWHAQAVTASLHCSRPSRVPFHGYRIELVRFCSTPFTHVVDRAWQLNESSSSPPCMPFSCAGLDDATQWMEPGRRVPSRASLIRGPRFRVMARGCVARRRVPVGAPGVLGVAVGLMLLGCRMTAAVRAAGSGPRMDCRVDAPEVVDTGVDASEDSSSLGCAWRRPSDAPQTPRGAAPRTRPASCVQTAT
jgi:hypothetical protein